MVYSKEKKGHPQKVGKQGDVKENGKREKMVLGWAMVVNQQHA
jgi:hypothetical protein